MKKQRIERGFGAHGVPIPNGTSVEVAVPVLAEDVPHGASVWVRLTLPSGASLRFKGRVSREAQ